MGGCNVRVSTGNAAENISSCRVPNYFSQLVGFRPDQLAIANWEKLAGDSPCKENNLIVCVFAICTGAGMWIHHLGLLGGSNRKGVAGIIAMLFSYCDGEPRYYKLVN